MGNFLELVTRSIEQQVGLGPAFEGSIFIDRIVEHCI